MRMRLYKWTRSNLGVMQDLMGQRCLPMLSRHPSPQRFWRRPAGGTSGLGPLQPHSGNHLSISSYWGTPIRFVHHCCSSWIRMGCIIRSSGDALRLFVSLTASLVHHRLRCPRCWAVAATHCPFSSLSLT
jgi:hypothetical protein